MPVNAVLRNEQRSFTRYDIKLPATLRLRNGVRLNGTMGNISSSGAWFENRDREPAEENTLCLLTIHLQKQNYREEIDIECVLKRNSTDGVGLKFKTMSTRDYINFVFLLTTETPHQQQLLTELKTNPGMELRD